MLYSAVAVLGRPQEVQSWEQRIDTRNRNTANFVWMRHQLPVKHYDGRFYWSGPSVIVDDLQDVLGATKVKCVWDELGSQFVVYPRAYSSEAIALMRSLDEADILSIYFFVKAGTQPHKRLAENCLKTIHSEFGLKVALLKAVTTEGV